jgi:hypothetical protein
VGIGTPVVRLDFNRHELVLLPPGGLNIEVNGAVERRLLLA